MFAFCSVTSNVNLFYLLLFFVLFFIYTRLNIHIF